MDRQTTFLLALALLVVAAAVVSAAGWTLFVRDRRAHHAALAAGAPATVPAAGDASNVDAEPDPEPEHHLEAAEER
jgi:hypothetical protein